MDNLNPQTEEKLGYPTILEHLAGRASTDDAKTAILHIKPFDDQVFLLEELARTDECKRLLDSSETYYLDYTGSVDSLIAQTSITGNWLNADEIFSFYKWLKMVRDLGNFFKGKKEKFPKLTHLAEGLIVDKELVARIERILDDRGNVKDTASDRLRDIRRSQANVSADLRKELSRILRNSIASGWSADSEITLRNDRLVIPMLADFKGRIKGFVHDISSSGQTIFIEPAETLDMNNRLRELIGEEQTEIVRIFTEFTRYAGSLADHLEGVADVVTHLDILRAKARMAQDLGAKLPRVSSKNNIYSLSKAYHPILLIRSRYKREKITPLNLDLDKEKRVILISGPNAGGKSVALKTVGLLQLMWQSGMLVPCEDESEFRMFNRVFVDIGDEQSIQSDLSTYTSHLRVMREMLDGLDNQSLFLLDEFGSGTDPRMGGAMAEAFLEKFVASGGYGVITTHYGNLKSYADKTSGIVNASMQFDPENLSPTYRIEVGIPGRSYAFEIASKAGIPESVIQRAKEKMEGGEVYSEELLLKLEEQRVELDQVIRDNREKREELGKLLQKNLTLNKTIEVEKAKILREAHEKAQNLIDSANAKIERTIREIKEIQAEKKKTHTLRKELVDMLPEPPPDLQEFEEPEEKEQEFVIPGVPVVGDRVRMRDTSSVGVLLEINGKRGVVAVGDLRITAKLKELQIIQPGNAPSNNKKSREKSQRIEKRANVSQELNVMGLRVEGAIPIVSKFMDDAILAGLTEVRILHGKGTGALREAIRQHVRLYPEVQSTKDERIEAGGEGWTVVRLAY